MQVTRKPHRHAKRTPVPYVQCRTLIGSGQDLVPTMGKRSNRAPAQPSSRAHTTTQYRPPSRPIDLHQSEDYSTQSSIVPSIMLSAAEHPSPLSLLPSLLVSVPSVSSVVQSVPSSSVSASFSASPRLCGLRPLSPFSPHPSPFFPVPPLPRRRGKGKVKNGKTNLLFPPHSFPVFPYPNRVKSKRDLSRRAKLGGANAPRMPPETAICARTLLTARQPHAIVRTSGDGPRSRADGPQGTSSRGRSDRVVALGPPSRSRFSGGRKVPRSVPQPAAHRR